MYTTKENVGLADVFIAMKNSKASLPDVKDNKAVKQYFETVYPDIDFDRVYASDMKKMIKWYEVLEKNNVDYTAKPEAEEQPVEEETVTEAVSTEEPAPKKTRSKSKAAAETKAEATTEEKPKKTTRKKKAEE